MSIAASDDYQIPILWRPCAAAPTGSILILPALGTRAEFYEPFAAALTERGYHVAVMELRGNGRSALRPSRRVDWGYAALMADMAAVVRWLRERAPALPVVPVGHSLGGQLAAAAAAMNPGLCEAMVLVASGSPFYDNFSGSLYWQLYLGSKITPLLSSLYGYFPGDRLGFGGREARGVMGDWLQLVVYNRFRIAGIEADVEGALSRYRGRVLSIRFDKDTLAPARAMAALNRKLAGADLSEVLLTASALGGRAGHFDWGRQPAAVVDKIDQWLNLPVKDTFLTPRA